MRVYTVHVRNAEAGPDDVRFVREGFTWPALFVPALWMLWHRMWWVLAAYLALSLAGGILARWLGIGDGPVILAGFAMALLVAWEADALRRWSLGRRGYRIVAFATGRSLADAERAFFSDGLGAHWSEPMAPLSVPAVQVGNARAWSRRQRDEAGIGLFPERGY